MVAVQREKGGCLFPLFADADAVFVSGCLLPLYGDVGVVCFNGCFDIVSNRDNKL